MAEDAVDFALGDKAKTNPSLTASSFMGAAHYDSYKSKSDEILLNM